MPEIKLPPEVVAAFDALEAGQSLDLVNTFIREDGMLLATVKVKGKQQAPSLPWQPISTAPIDGTRILLYWPDLYSTPYIATGRRDLNKYVRNSQPYWVPDNSHGQVAVLRVRCPTHWQPLLPPEEAK